MDVNQEQPIRRNRMMKSLKAKEDARRSFTQRFADWLTEFFGSITFLVANALWFISWIVINLGLVPGVVPFDPFPFGLLTMVVSLEAIVLAIIVLISQNRAARIADLREEIDLQINRIAEEEVTKMIQLQLMLLKKNGVKVDDPDIERMLRPLHSAEIEQRIQRQLNSDRPNNIFQ